MMTNTVDFGYMSGDLDSLGQMITENLNLEEKMDSCPFLCDSLIERVIKVHDYGQTYPLQVSEEVYDSLIERDEDGDTELHTAIICKDEKEIERIISIATDHTYLCSQNDLRQQPLHLAVITKQAEVVRRLMCAGAQVDVVDRNGNTPLHIACEKGYEEIVKHLLKPVYYEETHRNSYAIPYMRVPQDLTHRNFDGFPCIHLALKSRNTNIIQALVDRGANINIGDGKSGRTVLHKVADSGDNELLQFLLTLRKVDIGAENFAGQSPVKLAYFRKHYKTVDEFARTYPFECKYLLDECLQDADDHDHDTDCDCGHAQIDDFHIDGLAVAWKVCSY